MRYYVAYKFLNTDKETLKDNLAILSEKIKRTGNTSFIFYRDAQNRGESALSSKEIIMQAFAEIKKSDVIITFIESEEKSEGLLLEAGYAKALGKKLFLIIKKWVKLRFLEALADKMIEFDTIDEIKLLNN